MDDQVKAVMLDLAGQADPRRTNLSTVWTDGAHSYASDGRMLIRVHGREGAHANGILFDMTGTANNILAAPLGPVWVPVPAAHPVPGPRPCPRCHGAPTAACSACDGSGEVEWEFEHEGRDYDMSAACPICDGEGRIECPDCDGTGMAVPDEPSVVVGPVRIGAAYARLLARLPECRLAPAADPTAPVLFTFSGGVGAVMPTRNE